MNGLYNDHELDEAFVSLSRLSEQNADQVCQIIEDVDHFARHFLRREVKMLEEEFHVDPSLLAALQSAAQELRLALREERPALSKVKQRVGSMRDEACAISHGLKTVLDQKAWRKQVLGYAVTGLGGIVVMANHTPVGMAYFSAAGAASSWKLGLGLIGVGSTHLYAKVLEKIGSALG